jgi:uncharacterized damage-inducible protein DinB
MALSDAILPEFDHEMANTRKTLERVPDGKFQWQPHQKSYTVQKLASHLANIPAWTPYTLQHDSLDMAPKDGPSFTTPQGSSAKEILEWFDKNVADARASIAKTSDAEFMKPWSLLSGGKTILTMPKIAVLRGFILSHNIHHRAQLGVYFRLLDIPVPSTYGPSADEQSM